MKKESGARTGAERGVVIEATIAELSAGGDGVAICTIDGERRAVFVPGVAAGDRVRLAVDDAKRPARGRVLALLEPSPSRIAPACPHVARCGGCDWMHLTRDAQVRAHVEIVARALPAEMRGVEIHTHAAPKEVGYRVRARVHLGVGRSGKVSVGMFGRSTHEPADVDACIVLHPSIEAVRRDLAAIVAGARGKGEASIALGAPGGETRRAVLDLRWSGDLPAPVFARLDHAVREGRLAGARVFAGVVKSPATIGDPTPWVAGADGAPLRLAPGGFSQAAEEANAALATRVAEIAEALVGPSREGASVIELYAGAGNLTVLLARRFRVTAVESDRDACDAARKNLAARGLTAKVTEADASSFAIPSGTRLVVLDPPRAGARDVARALAEKPVPAALYVSCDPATLGRDLATLAPAGYEAAAVETFEMFPQTSHVETVVGLRRARR
jgi:23S rRNA (uracil1939-C5)-methyltransferase